MSKTTFSGPVASQNGFVAPTFTSTTLPYFEIGNIVYVSDLNTLAFGGVDQWYDQSTGTGLGTGGQGGGGSGTTYTVGVDYTNSPAPGVAANTMGGMGAINIETGAWTNMTGVAEVLALPIGTVITLTGPNTTGTITTTSTFTNFGPGQYFVQGTPSFDTMGMTYAANSISFP
jgi:hypothetical protein